LFGSLKPREATDERSAFANTFLSTPEEVEWKGEIITRKTIAKLLKFFALVNPSCYTPVPQVKNKVFNGAVPVFMYGQRLYNGVPYEYWKTECYKSLQAVVPYAFNRSEILDFDWKYHKWEKNEEQYPGEIEQFRVKMLTPRESSVRAPYTSYKNNKVYISKAKQEFTGEPGSDLSAEDVRGQKWDSLPSIVRQMIAQTWIFAPEVRLVDRQIMDLQNWDNIPAPIGSNDSSVRVRDISPPEGDLPF
jgi:hypothetical protein